MLQFDAPEESLGTLDAQAAGNLIASAGDVALIVDEEGVIRDMAFGSEELSREAHADWLGKRWIDTVTEESRPKVDALLRDAAAKGAPRWRHINQQSRGGTDIPLMYSAVHFVRGGRQVDRVRRHGQGRGERAKNQTLRNEHESLLAGWGWMEFGAAARSARAAPHDYRREA